MRQGLFPQVTASVEPTVNLTPLIDVVFVILIMFIVISPLLNVDQIELARSKEIGGQNANEAGILALHIRSDNSIWYQNRQITLEQLPQLFLQTKKRDSKAHPQLFFDQKASFGTYQAIKNSAESANFEALDIILKPS